MVLNEEGGLGLEVEEEEGGWDDEGEGSRGFG